MNRVKDNLVSVFVSFEFLIFLGTLLAYPLFSDRIAALAAQLGDDSEKIKWLALIPVALLGWMIANAKELLFPEAPNAELLHDWPDYVMVKDRHIISLVSGALCSAFSVGVWMFCAVSTNALAFTVLTASILISIATFASYHLATVKIRNILNAQKANSNK